MELAACQLAEGVYRLQRPTCDMPVCAHFRCSWIIVITFAILMIQFLRNDVLTRDYLDHRDVCMYLHKSSFMVTVSTYLH